MYKFTGVKKESYFLGMETFSIMISSLIYCIEIIYFESKSFLELEIVIYLFLNPRSYHNA